ncbi:MAG: hypothetical protein PWQ67_1561 [Clostridia bacterium]|jgi:hypothetical protein|nr:hypothetical protein [Clostridia bacterium]MDN5323107.1 hypothetical protein [Clostridia bacterium]
MPTRLVFCKSELCGTNKLELKRIKLDFKKANLEFLEMDDLCGNIQEVNKLKGDLVFVGCSGKVIKGKIDESNKRIVFANIREECLWLYNDEETIYREVLLEIRIALHRLKFKKTTERVPLNCFRNKVGKYIEIISEIGPNPFKV